ncbi:hypothetical protein HN419_05275 [Candidatus Woesearchaeota archaeon]|jgi:hypothetical protein|nr:hypothetical protein [Candidatus Woesearchaeota archaeon]MBT3537717.1 hypothetical protein [Candidatus Woesearchaeota archaeon]MBT4697848.1 hypothetical protein [Candidatus Woesearchaeota archaeon]MBT4717492.1 hypothetical protein [Candidatus Woesearchaeota archaeon]MBT7105386.1 hypothetical protein [Candidatus Woesearchaeota archaeon]
MNNNNLIPITSTERARELGSKGGKVRSRNKRMAARLRELRKKGLTDEVSNKIVSLIDDKDCFAIEILMLIEEIRPKCYSADMKIKLANILIQLLKIHHGANYRVRAENVNVTVEKPFWEEFQEAYDEMKREEKLSNKL